MGIASHPCVDICTTPAPQPSIPPGLPKSSSSLGICAVMDSSMHWDALVAHAVSLLGAYRPDTLLTCRGLCSFKFEWLPA